METFLEPAGNVRDGLFGGRGAYVHPIHILTRLMANRLSDVGKPVCCGRVHQTKRAKTLKREPRQNRRRRWHQPTQFRSRMSSLRSKLRRCANT